MSLFQDEFEEFRARANSGGSLPERLRRRRDRSVEVSRPPSLAHTNAGFASEPVAITSPVALQDNVFCAEKRMDSKHLLLKSGSSSTDSNKSKEGIPYPSWSHHDPDWDIGDMRPRVCSMPTQYLHHKKVLGGDRHKPPPLGHFRGAENRHRLRSFSITRKGVIVNEGETFVTRRSHDCLSEHEHEGMYGHDNMCLSRTTSFNSQGSTPTNSVASNECPLYRVQVLGGARVGKTTLIHQFMASEYAGAQDSSFDDEGLQKTVSILLDGEESTMEFIDGCAADSRGVKESKLENADAYVVLYSVEDRRSFEEAIDILFDLRNDGSCDDHHQAVIMVANKCELVRSREILEDEGKIAAESYGCKYTEISTVIDHKVDELLVGILKQIRLHKKRMDKQKAKPKPKPEELCCLLRARQNVLSKFIHGDRYTSRSCDDLLGL